MKIKSKLKRVMLL